MPDFTDLIDLASHRLGGSVLYATDDFFSEKENLLKPEKAIWKEHEYTDRGKWMDGWESRRKRTPGHDFAIIRLGAPGVVLGVVVDTSYFRGNYPAECSFQGCFAPPETEVETLLAEETRWFEILERSPLQGDFENKFAIDNTCAVTHIRLHIYPDGGVARLRVHGEVVPDWRRIGGLKQETDLAAVQHGAVALECSDMFFGNRNNLLMPGRAKNMSDGWETKRRRGPGHDWVIVQLAAEGTARRIEVDTSHFKGNYPDTCSIEALVEDDWMELLPRTKLQADTLHVFLDELEPAGAATQLRLNVFPDGGVARMRVFGTATERGRAGAAARFLDTRTEDRARAALAQCCGSARWVDQMMEARPFGDGGNLLAVADRVWKQSSTDDLMEAFAAHPRIGDSKGSRWSQQEQSGTSAASSATMTALTAANEAYDARYGFRFIVCATGKSAEEMLAIVQSRSSNDRERELQIAAEEQRKIVRIRLLKLVE